MGKPTGFMEYPRCENRRRPPLERAADWEDIYVPVEGAQRLDNEHDLGQTQGDS